MRIQNTDFVVYVNPEKQADLLSNLDQHFHCQKKPDLMFFLEILFM